MAEPGSWIIEAQTATFEADVIQRSMEVPVVVDFWAQWCVACTELDRKTFLDESVRKALADRYLSVRIDATHDDQRTKALLDRFRVLGLPSILILEPDGTETTRVTQFVEPEQLASEL